jgi:acyl-CoA dehydrogenase
MMLGMLLLVGAAAVVAAGLPALRGTWLTPRLFALFKKVSPTVSDTERVALEAGSVAWDRELFTGKPDWQAPAGLQATKGFPRRSAPFSTISAPSPPACATPGTSPRSAPDLPQALWDYLKQERFFGMIIPKAYGGMAFSAKAQSLVLQKLSISETLMVTVGVPNSLGPGELLLKYGTDEQKDHYLPRLADGREIPCFALTGPRAGSDATAIPDTGVVCRQVIDGKEELGLRLNFEKRWITLAPIATVVGLAFRLFDPDHLLGEEADRGITLALIPRHTRGMEIGRRHHPIGSPFLNGPIKGKGRLRAARYHHRRHRDDRPGLGYAGGVPLHRPLHHPALRRHRHCPLRHRLERRLRPHPPTVQRAGGRDGGCPGTARRA